MLFRSAQLSNCAMVPLSVTLGYVVVVLIANSSFTNVHDNFFRCIVAMFANVLDRTIINFSLLIKDRYVVCAVGHLSLKLQKLVKLRCSFQFGFSVAVLRRGGILCMRIAEKQFVLRKMRSSYVLLQYCSFYCNNKKTKSSYNLLAKKFPKNISPLSTNGNLHPIMTRQVLLIL